MLLNTELARSDCRVPALHVSVDMLAISDCGRSQRAAGVTGFRVVPVSLYSQTGPSF